MKKEKLQKMTPAQIAETLTPKQLQEIGRLAVIRQIHILRDDDNWSKAHNDWIFTMSHFGILKEFENG